eukprot:358405-Amphidinium_carterae.1
MMTHDHMLKLVTVYDSCRTTTRTKPSQSQVHLDVIMRRAIITWSAAQACAHKMRRRTKQPAAQRYGTKQHT